jgi:hypothetical protein
LREGIVHSKKLLAFVLVVSSLGCTKAAPPAPPPDTRVENPELGIQLAAVPDGLEVALNQGRYLELRPTAEGIEGLISFFVGPEEHSVNLVQAVHDHQAKIESLPDGEYLGAQELTGDAGVVFYSRGRYSEEGATAEETVLFLIHPSQYSLLEIRYRYPAGDDSAARVEKLIQVLSEVE